MTYVPHGSGNNLANLQKNLNIDYITLLNSSDCDNKIPYNNFLKIDGGLLIKEDIPKIPSTCSTWNHYSILKLQGDNTGSLPKDTINFDFRTYNNNLGSLGQSNDFFIKPESDNETTLHIGSSNVVYEDIELDNGGNHKFKNIQLHGYDSIDMLSNGGLQVYNDTGEYGFMKADSIELTGQQPIQANNDCVPTCNDVYNHIHNLTEDNSPDDVLFYNATTKEITYGDKTTISSDRRLKYDIEDLENCILITRQLHPKKYMKKNKIEDASGNGKFQIGLIAQDILDISNVKGLHKLVAGGDYYDAKLDARVASAYAVKYNDIHVITLGAVKELDKIVQQQQAQINMLTNRLILCEKNKREKSIEKTIKC